MRGARVGTAVAGLLLLAALLEGTARVVLFGAAGLDPRRVDSVHTMYETGFLRPSEHAELGFELAPDVRGYFKLAPFRTNAQGLRYREVPVEKPPGIFRVAVLGSSFTLPAGVAREQSFHGVLERRLAERSPGRPPEFVNFAVGAYSALQSHAMLRLRALAYDPDLVLFCVTRLSLPGLQAHWRTPLLFRGIPPRSHPFFSSFFLRLVRVRAGGELPRPMPPIVTPDRQRAAALPRGGSTSVLAQLARLNADRVPVVLVRLAFDPSDASPLDLLVAGRARELGLPFLDTLPAFDGMDPRRFWIHELDPHPDPAAHAIFADVIEASLRENHLLP